MALQEDEAFVSGVNFHGGEEVFNFTWDATCILPADYDWWILVGKEYVDAVHLYSPSNYMNGIFCSCTNPPSPVCYPGLCNGKSWYIAEGTRQDYTNYDDHTREFTLEIGPKTPQASTLPSYWNYNRRSFLNFMDQALYGIHGVVTDAATGDSIFAKIFVENHDADNSFVMTDPRVGYYARPIKGGTYNVTYSAAGYISQTINITVADYQKVIQNVALMPETPPALPPIANFSFDTKLITTGVPTEVHFEDRSLNLPTSWQWYFEGGDPETSTEKNPVVSYLIEDLAKIQTIKVELTAINAHGEDTKEDFLTVGAPPASDFTAEPTTLIAGNNVSFFDITANDPETWKWTFEGGDPETSTEQNPVVIYRHPGKYTVTLTTKNIFGANSHTKENYITVLETELPIADFYADTTCIFVGESVHFTSYSENAVTWEWYFEGGTPETSDEENPIVVYENAGNFDVKLTVTNDEGEDEMLKENYICVKEKESIDEVNGLKIKVFPNPVSQGATVTIDADSPVRKIEWLNMAGALIKTIYADAASCTFSVSGIDAGFYLMKVETEKGISVTKIQVQ
jgi:PKD repeat protein